MTRALVIPDQNPLWAKVPCPCRKPSLADPQGLGYLERRLGREAPKVWEKGIRDVGACGGGGLRRRGQEMGRRDEERMQRCVGRAGQGCHSAAGTNLPAIFFPTWFVDSYCLEEGMLLSKGSWDIISHSPTLAWTHPPHTLTSGLRFLSLLGFCLPN